MTGIILSQSAGAAGPGFLVPGLAPVAGRYRVIDFVLSNLVNGGITDVGILCGGGYPALSAYVSGGRDWALDRRRGGVVWLDQEAAGTVSLEAYLKSQSSAYGVVCGCGGGFSLDVRQVLVSHLASGHDLTAVMVPQKAEGGDRVLLCLLGRELLLRFLAAGERPETWLRTPEELPRTLAGRPVTQNLFTHAGPFLEFGTQEQLLQNNLRVLEPGLWQQLFDPDRPVYTRPQDGPPAWWGEEAACTDSLISGGCRVEGTLERAVLSEGVVIGPGARVRDSVLLEGARVGAQAELDRVIVDSGGVIPEHARHRGRPGHPVFVAKGASATT